MSNFNSHQLSNFIEKNIFSSIEGGILYVAVTSDFKVVKVKSIATEHFYGHQKELSPDSFKLVHANLLKRLKDENTLSDEQILESGV